MESIFFVCGVLRHLTWAQINKKKPDSVTGVTLCTHNPYETFYVNLKEIRPAMFSQDFPLGLLKRNLKLGFVRQKLMLSALFVIFVPALIKFTEAKTQLCVRNQRCARCRQSCYMLGEMFNSRP